jgi:hypothetical protein
LIVLSKTHACAIADRTRAKAAHRCGACMRFVYMSDNFDVFFRPNLANTG